MRFPNPAWVAASRCPVQVLRDGSLSHVYGQEIVKGGGSKYVKSAADIMAQVGSRSVQAWLPNAGDVALALADDDRATTHTSHARPFV